MSADRVQDRPPDGYSSTLASMIGSVQERGGDTKMEGRNASIGGSTGVQGKGAGKKLAYLHEQTTGGSLVARTELPHFGPGRCCHATRKEFNHDQDQINMVTLFRTSISSFYSK